ncbi:MAG TPA: nuclear transport factor 2 family protein [Rubrivivax sp.]
MAHPKSQTAALMTSPEDIEAEFYEALQLADLERLMAVWADDDEVVCVHPGAGTRVIGTAAVRASFEAIFTNGGVPVEVTQVHRVHTLGSAVHHLVERLQVRTAEGVQTAWVLATNVYVKTAQGWRMVAHHASPGQLGEGPALPEPASTLH